MSASQTPTAVRTATLQPSMQFITAHQQSSSPDSVTDHLQRCMDNVEELGKTIACAISVWHGHEKTGDSDVNGSYTKVTAALGQLSTGLQCVRCLGSVSWSDFDPTRSASGGCGTCQCTVIRPFAKTWKALECLPMPNTASMPTGLPLRQRSVSPAPTSARGTKRNLDSVSSQMAPTETQSTKKVAKRTSIVEVPPLPMHAGSPPVVEKNGPPGKQSTRVASLATLRPSPLACDLCRRKHLKCDGASPTCNRCASEPAQCTYGASRRARDRGARKVRFSRTIRSASSTPHSPTTTVSTIQTKPEDASPATLNPWFDLLCQQQGLCRSSSVSGAEHPSDAREKVDRPENDSTAPQISRSDHEVCQPSAKVHNNISGAACGKAFVGFPVAQALLDRWISSGTFTTPLSASPRLKQP